MISEATVISKPVSRVNPFSSGPLPMVIPRKKRSEVSITRRQVMVSGSISRRHSLRRSSGVSSSGSEAVMPSFSRRTTMPLVKWRLPLLSSGQQAVEKLLIGGIRFVEHARINGGRHQVVGSGDGMDITGQVQVEFFHGNHLRIAAAGSSALDAKGGSLRWLADAGDHAFIQDAHPAPG